MSDLIAWYLVELRSRLAPFLDPKLVETIVGETKSHLNESISRLQGEQQIDEDQATASAIEAYGEPERVALAHLRERAWRPFGIKPIWLVIIGALASTTCWMLNWQWLEGGYFDNRGVWWENAVALLVCLLSLAVFAIGCYAGRRRFRAAPAGICLAMMIAVPFLYSYLIVGSNMTQEGFSRLHLNRDVEKARKSLAEMHRLGSYVTDGERIFASAKSAKDIPPAYTDPVLATQLIGAFSSRAQATDAQFDEVAIEPYLSFQGETPSGADRKPVFVAPGEYGGPFADADGRLETGLQQELSFSRAKDFWKQRLQRFPHNLDYQETKLSDLLAAAAEAHRGRVFFFDPQKYVQQVQDSIPSFLIILLIVESLAFSRLRQKRRRPEFVRA